ncbi:MAG TPA: excinuclease ABC subunit UvrC [Gammaproteobacteria bacterium]|nr:excinuclease ABC subunit UvrC [Gammaproteobacteria bacterium]
MADMGEPEFDSREFLKTLTSRPGVYRMMDGAGKVIYVGKARNLKRRLASYFRKNLSSPKTRSMVAQIRRVEITITHTENEALILENNIIKELKPRYNILLRDDKSYPYIHLSTGHRHPRLTLHRGAKRGKGRYFGPYPSAGAVRETLNLMQKLFRVRQCEDSFYANRSRPCLQYQIERCSAPCTGAIDDDRYLEEVRHAELFLEGRSNAVIDRLVERMQAASAALEFEQAARYRDQIATLRRVQERQYVSGSGGDLDVVAARVRNGVGCVQLFSIRNGRNLGNRCWFPRHTDRADASELLAAFLPQYYLGSGREIPPEILLNQPLEESEWLAGALTERAGGRVVLRHRLRGERRRWVQMAEANADAALETMLAGKSNMRHRFEALQEALELEELPRRIECFDISHTFGESPVGACVVFDINGPVKSDYRRFNIRQVAAGDDYAALQQALLRRYTRVKKGEGKLPDVLIVDGGKGQLSQAARVLEELQITGVTLLGIAKGPSRKPGRETLFLSGCKRPLILPGSSPALHLIQQLDSEAHRFAIGGHRRQRGKARTSSALEEIRGLGPKRRRQLLQQFGGLQEVARAGIDDLARVSGISRELAERIYERFHPDREGG